MLQARGWLKDLLFPKFCVSCQHEGLWLCESCLQIVLTRERLPAQAGLLIPPYVDGVTALFQYGGSIISKLIGLLKYNFLLEVGEEFGNIILAIDVALPYSDFTLMAVPLHPRRQRERGFNQATVLAELFAKKLKLPIKMNLQRTLYTEQQAKLTAVERKKNLTDAFIFVPGENKVPEKILLIDDVFTTGATMSECAKVLKNNGVQVVWGLAIAHG